MNSPQYNGLPEGSRGGNYTAGEGNDLPLPGPWSTPRAPAPAPTPPADEEYLESPWGRVPIPLPPAETRGREPDVSGWEPAREQPAARQGERQRATPTGEDANLPRRRSMPVRDGSRGRGNLYGEGGENGLCPAAPDGKAVNVPVRYNAGLEVSGENDRYGTCRVKPELLLTPGNIKAGIILVEILGRRGGRARRR